ncbi:sensor histidine kinase [Clostridium sp.]|uniref:sensor histidine kinase n=1 Tax=Clostridium sp. TaxID=1506 RepID=UPI003EEA1166
MENTYNNIIIEPYFCTCDGIITEVNKEFIDFTGFKMNELLGKSLMVIGDILKLNSQILLDNINDKYSGYIFTKSLHAREVNISLFNCSEANKKLYSFLEKKDSRLDDKLIFEAQTFIDDISGVAVYSAPDLVLLKTNQKYLNLVGSAKTIGNNIGKYIREIVPGFVGSQDKVTWGCVIESQKNSYIKEYTVDNSKINTTYWRFSKTAIFEKGKTKYIFETISEVTEKVYKNQNTELQEELTQQECVESKAQTVSIIGDPIKIEEFKKKLEASKSRYKFLYTLIDTLDLPIARISYPDLKIVDVNKKAFSIIKLLVPNLKSMNQIKDTKIENLSGTFKTSEYYKCIGEVIKEKKTNHLNNKKHLIDGYEVYWNVIFEPMLGVGGEILEILILIIDVTAEIKANIVMGEELKSQGEFLVNISHDLKAPLNVISATAQLFNMYCNSGSLDDKKGSIVKYIKSIKQNSYRISKLINNIVDLSKIQAGFFKLELSNNNIVEVVENIVTSVTDFTDSKGISIIFDTDIDEKNIACDPEKLERMVLNLISNAIKFTDEGGEIFIDVKDKNEFIEISVKDNGIGIEDKYLDIIFDRFKQVDKSISRNVEGTGIGLSLVKSIVDLHGGSIYVDSEIDKGSKFTVWIPSRNSLNVDITYNNEVKNISQNIHVELSDVCS